MRITGSEAALGEHAQARQRHGIVRRAELQHAGWSGRRITFECASGSLRRLRNGWYALPGASPMHAAAVRVGGVLGCVSLLRSWGVWVPIDPRVHVTVAANAARLRASPLTIRHYVGRAAPDRVEDSLIGAIRQALRCLPADFGVAVLDSVVEQRIISAARLRRELEGAGSGIAALLRLMEPGAQSGLETLVRVRLRRRGIIVRIQVVIAGVGRVDLVVGDRLVIETDGRAFHSGPAAFEEDRRRDLALAAAGYRVLRLSYRQILDDWPAVEEAVLELVRRREHRWPRGAGAQKSGTSPRPRTNQPDARPWS